MLARRELKGTYQRRESVPRPEGDEEAQVTEEKHASIFVDGVEYGDRLGLLVVGVDLWGRPELLELEAHNECSGMVTVEKQGYYPERSLERWLSKKKMLACREGPGQRATQAIICTAASANALNSGVNVHFRGANG
jgi:hypothetical protein